MNNSEEKIKTLEKRIKELETLYEVSAYELSAALNENVHLKEVIELTLNTVMKLLGAERGCIMLWNKDEKELCIAAEKCPDDKPFGLRRMKSGEGIAGWAFEQGEIFIVDDVTKEPRFVSSPGDQIEIKSIISVPLLVEDRKIGVINVGTINNYHNFSGDEIKTLKLVASRAALVIENVNLRQNEKEYIEKLHKTSEELKKQSRELNVIMDNMADGVLTFDRYKKITSFNSAAEKIIGINREEAAGKFFTSILALKTEDGLNSIEDFSFDDGTFENCIIWEGFLEQPDGCNRFISAIPTSLTNELGTESCVVVFRDLTKEKEIEQLKSDFVSYVSHEMRSPLTCIKGYTSVLINHGEKFCPEKRTEYLNIINEEVDRLTRLIKNLLDLARIERGMLEISREEINIPFIVNKVVNNYKISSLNHRFELNFSQDFPSLYGDKDQIEQVINNLISNGIKYSPSGGTISVSGTKRKSDVLISIEDEGPGIPEEWREKVFDKFFRVRNSEENKIVGTGLGLYITKNIINSHGGNIWTENRTVGTGSKFCFSMPWRDGNL